MGRLGADPDVRYTQNQAPVATLSVATTDSWSKDGQRREQTEWHRVVVWNRQAENCAKYLSKGRAVFVEGKLQTRSWEDKAGQKRYTTEILANSVQFIGSSSSATDSQRESADNSAGVPGESFEQNSRFPQVDQQSSTAKQTESAVNFDDIPF